MVTLEFPDCFHTTNKLRAWSQHIHTSLWVYEMSQFLIKMLPFIKSLNRGSVNAWSMLSVMNSNVGFLLFYWSTYTAVGWYSVSMHFDLPLTGGHELTRRNHHKQAINDAERIYVATISNL